MAGETRPFEEAEAAISFWYEPTQPPSGGDWPQSVKDQWVGTRLPVADQECIIPPKAILPEDLDLHTTFARPGYVKVETQAAISALRLAGKTEAADFWVSVAKVEGWSDDNLLYFRLDEGNVLDPESGTIVEILFIPFSEDEFETPEDQLVLDIE